MLTNEVVICGPPRTGTTALCNIFNSYERSFVFNELGCYITPKHRFQSHLQIKLESEDFVRYNQEREIDLYTLKYEEPSDIPLAISKQNHNLLVVGDKLPGAVLRPELITILEKRPDMKFIFTIRDYRAVIASSIRAYQEGKREPWIFDRVEQAAYMWYKYATSVYEAMRIVKQDNFMLLRYESSVNNPIVTLERINCFLNLSIPQHTLTRAGYAPTNMSSWCKEIGPSIGQLPNYIKETGRLFGYE